MKYDQTASAQLTVVSVHVSDAFSVQHMLSVVTQCETGFSCITAKTDTHMCYTDSADPDTSNYSNVTTKTVAE